MLEAAPLSATRESSLETARAMVELYKDDKRFRQARALTELPARTTADVRDPSEAFSSSTCSARLADEPYEFLTDQVQCYPKDLDEAIMTIEGAKVDACGKLEVSSYMSFKDYFANESLRIDHPVRENPGTKEDEQDQLTGLKWWSDARGKGWITKCKNQTKWFSAVRLGSWRYAFVLARLQRDIWFNNADDELTGAQRPAIGSKRGQPSYPSPYSAKCRAQSTS